MSSMVRNFPLLLAYILYPTIMMFSRVFELSLARIWIDVVWVLLGIFVIFFAIARLSISESRRVAWYVVPFFIIIVILAVLKWGGGWYFSDIELIPYFMELKPVVYLLFAWAWVQVFGRLWQNYFVVFGAILGIIIIVDFFVESILAGSISRPYGSGEINYDACLLLISLIMSLVGKCQVRRVWTWLVVIGLFLTFSRTALAAAIVIIFLYSSVKFKTKLTISSLAFLFAIGSFVLRDLPLDTLSSMDRYWMWVSGIGLFIESPGQLVFGFPVGVALPANTPMAMEWLWESQSAGWGLSGVYPYNFHAFWLRLTITWGILAIGFLLMIVVLMLSRRREKLKKALYMLVLIEGVTMGLFYLSNVGVPLFLALLVQDVWHPKKAYALKRVAVNREPVSPALSGSNSF